MGVLSFTYNKGAGSRILIREEVQELVLVGMGNEAYWVREFRNCS
jgi:hypothetical protein